MNRKNKLEMIRLEKFEKSDYDRLIRWITNEETTFLFSGGIFTYPITYEQLDDYLCVKNRIVYRVVDTETNTIIGHAEFNAINQKNKNSRICRVLIGDKENRGKGYGTLVMKELVRIGFEELNLHRIDLGVHDFNKGAIKCYQKCGFEIEGLLRDSIRHKGKYWSAYNMSIINNR